MRISADKHDPSYHPAPLRDFDITVDGVSLRDAGQRLYVVTADADAGEVVEYRRGEHGRFIMCPDAPGRLQRFTRAAAVQITKRGG